MSDDRKQGGRPGGDKPAFRGGSRPSGGNRFHSDKPRAYGDRKPVGDKPYVKRDGPRPAAAGGERKPFDGERRPYSGDKPRFDGERKSFGGERKPFNGERKSFGGDKPRFDGERKSFSGDRKPFHGERKPYGGDKPRFDGERKPFRPAGDRPDGERKPFRPAGDRPDGERKPFRPAGDRPDGERKPFRPAGDRPMGERKPFRPAGDRPMGERKPFRPAGDRPMGERKPFRPAGDRPMGERKPFRPAGDRPVRPVRVQTNGLPARRIALNVIRRTTENGAYASLVLDELLTGCGLSIEDRRFAARLAYDTLQHLLYLDHALNQVMAKPDTDIKLRNVLRLGACQLLLEDRIPEFAITDTCVELCKELGMDGLHGVCNGILRNLIRQKDELTFPAADDDSIEALSIRYSVPQWLAEKLVADYGLEEAKSLMGCHQQEAVVIRPNLTKLDDVAFEKLLETKVWQHEPGLVPHSVRITGMADIGKDNGFLHGEFSIQGESSMLACMALDPKRGQSVLDCCAAPGGKTCYIAEMMGGTGRVYSWDLHPHRVDLIEAQVRRLGLENVRTVIRDATQPREEMIETIDALLLDAPCSGTGDMADKPDVKYRPTPESLQELLNTQMALLDTAAMYVKKGGTLVYSTCSVLKDENERQVAAFLQRHPEFKLDALPQAVPARFRLYEQTGLQLLPHRDNVGGFYICRMKRSRL